MALVGVELETLVSESDSARKAETPFENFWLSH